MKKSLLALVLLSACITLIACGGRKPIEHDYQQSESVDRVVVPDAMPVAQVEQKLVDYYPVPPRAAFEADDYIYFLPIPSAVAKDIAQQIAMHRLGSNIWLYVPFIPSQLWPTLQQYFDQNNMAILGEGGTQGFIDVQSSGSRFRFRIQQGFQTRSSELSVRLLNNAPQWQWTQPVDEAAEIAALQNVAEFLLKIADEKAYSFIARGISVEKRMDEVKDDNGFRRLRLYVDSQRAFASLKLGLERAEFSVTDMDPRTGVITARYLPPAPEDEQPGWFKRLIGFKRLEYDNRIPYAGNTYQFIIIPQSEKDQKVALFRSDAKWKSAREQRHEYNAIIRLLRNTIR